MCLYAGYARIAKSVFLAPMMESNRPLANTSDHQSPSGEPADLTIAIVAPQWLQDGLAVVIKSIPGVRLVACTSSIHILLSLDLERVPDVVLLTVDAPEIKAGDQIRQVRFVYPRAHIVTLIQEPAQSISARAAGADETLLQGASAEQFSARIGRLVKGERVE